MKDNLQKVLEKLNQLSKKVDKNTDIVKDLRSHNRWAFFFKIVYWGFLIAIGYGAWQLIQPVLDSFSSAIDTISQTGESLKGPLDNLSGVVDTLKNLKQ